MPRSPRVPAHTYRPPARVYLTLVAFFALSLPGVIYAGHEFWQSGSLRLTFTLAGSVVMLSVGFCFVILAPLEIQLTENHVVIRHLTHRTTVPVELIERVDVCEWKRKSRYLPQTNKVLLHVRGRAHPLVLIESHFRCESGELVRRLHDLVRPTEHAE